MPADVSGHCTPGPSPDKPRRSVHRTSVSDHGSQLTVAGLPVRPGRRAPGSTFDRGAALSQDQWTSAVTASATRSMPLKIHLIDRREVRRWRMATSEDFQSRSLKIAGYHEFRPVKRSSALRGRNRTRNNRTDGAPKRARAPGSALDREPLCCQQANHRGDRFGHRSHASENPFRRSPSGCRMWHG